MAPRVIGVLRRFLPEYLRTRPSLTPVQWRAIRAITQCRTPALGGHHYACRPCKKEVFAFHSCNHKACPQCGREATREWVDRELAKRVNAPYFMVTFTLPAELRGLFFGPPAKAAYDIFFAAAAQAALDAGLGVNAGHDLNRDNLAAFVQQVPGVSEVSIGHALIADALELGYGATVEAYLRCLQA